MTRRPVVLVATVHFLDSALTARALRSLPADPNAFTLHRIVWDNSGDASPAVHDLADQVVTAAVNVGYGRAIARLWRMHESDYVCFLTNDSWLDVGSLERLVAYLETEPLVGAVAPTLVDDEGHPLASTYRYPTVASVLAHQSMVAPQLRWLWRRIGRHVPAAFDPAPQVTGRTKAGSPDGPVDVEVVDGAVVVVRTAALHRIGGPDSWFALYGDDHDLCRRLRAAGYRVVHHRGIGGGHSVASTRAAVADHLRHEKLLTQVELIRRRHGRAGALALRLALTATAIGPGWRTQLRCLWGSVPERLPCNAAVRVSGRPPASPLRSCESPPASGRPPATSPSRSAG